MGDVEEGPPVDPGWRDSLVGIAWLPTMFLVQWRIRRSKLPALLLMRRFFVMFLTSFAFFGSARAGLDPRNPPWTARSAVALGAAIVVFCLAELALMRRLVERPLPCANPPSLAAMYRVRFFLRLAFASAPAMFGFTFSFVSGHWWVYLFGLAPAAVGMFMAAPTDAAIEREQRRLDAQGCSVNLLAALLEPRGGQLARP